MRITERVQGWRRERRVLSRVSRSAWRLAQAERERTWALASARAEGVSIRTLAGAVGLSPTRVHQLVTGAELDVLDMELGELRAAGWPAPEDPDTSEDTELDGREVIADRLCDEVEWIRRCARWLHHLHTQTYPPAVNLRPADDWPDRALVMVDLPRVQAILERIAVDIDELARARRVADLTIAAVGPDRAAEQRRRAAEEDLGFRQFSARHKLAMSSTPQLEHAWDTWQAERHRRGETDQHPRYTDNPFRPH